MDKNKNSRREKRARTLGERSNELPPYLLRLARATFDIADDAFSHEECVNTIPAFVDAEMAGELVVEKYDRVKQHLALCDDCAEQYAALLELTLAERLGQTPKPR